MKKNRIKNEENEINKIKLEITLDRNVDYGKQNIE